MRNGERPSVFLFYHPSYAKYEDQYVWAEDTIVIENEDDVQFDLYIMKQENTGLRDEELRILESQYECNIEQSLTNYQWNLGWVGANIYTNLRENLGNTGFGNLRGPEVNYEVEYIWYGRRLTTTGTLNAFQTETEARKRIYEVTVKVYEEDSNFRGEPLGTLTGAILK